MGQKGKGICKGMKYVFHKHVAPIGICIGILILLSADIGVVSASPSITDWSSSGGYPTNKDNPQDLAYLALQGDTTAFSVNASESVTYNWYVNKLEQENNQNIFTWTVPNKKGIWEIHVKASNANGEDHIEWVVSTLNVSEAPDIFDYFTDKKYSNRTETDLWGRALPEWHLDYGSFDVSSAYLSAGTGTDYLKYPTTIAYGTWKFKYRFPDALLENWRPGGLEFYPICSYSSGSISITKSEDSHDHAILKWAPPNQFSMDYDAGVYAVNDQWMDMTVIKKEDGWFYIYRGDILVYYCQDNSLTTNIDMLMRLKVKPAHIDQFEVYENKYLFPEKEIVFDEYVANYLCPSVYPEPVKRDGIVVMGGTITKPVTLRDINDAIANPALFTYDSDTNTAISYTDLVVFDGAVLNIENETLKFHCDHDGELYFAPKYASYLNIKNSNITTDTDYYFVWNNAGSTTHFGGSASLYSEFGTYYSCTSGYGNTPFNPIGTLYPMPSIPWSCYARFIIEDSVINNTAHIFFDSPKDLIITNTEFTNLHELDIGNYEGTWPRETTLQRTYAQGEKSFWIVLDEMAVHDFNLTGITFSGASNLTFMVNSLRDRINIYDIDAGNANIVVRKPLAQNAIQSLTWTPYTPQGETYIDSELGLVNCKFKNLLITTDNAGGVPKYYLDVKVIDVNGDTVSDATVNVTNEVDATYSAENVKAERIYATGDWDNFYHHYRFLIGQPLTSTITGSDGHTPLPSDKANTFVISDYVKDQTSQTNFTYSITTSKDGKTASLPNWDIDESWYREDQDTPTKTVVCNIDTGECRVESVATGANSPTTNATLIPAPDETGWNNVTPVVVTSFRSDNDSGISHTNYSKTSETGPWTTVTTSAATGPDAGNVTEISEGGFNVTMSDEGTTEIWFYSVDNDSNVEPLKNITVKIDTTPHIKNLIIQSPNDVTDNRLREASPDAVLGSTTFIDVGLIGSTGNYRDVIWFNLTQLNTTDLIESAKLSLFWYYESRDMGTTVEIYRPVDWAETYVNWNNRTNGVAWIYPGGDWYDTNNVAQGNTPYAAVTFPVGTPDNAYHEFDVTELVQSYVDGIYENSGFFIKANEVSDGYIAFRSSDWTNADERPKLVVSYGSGDAQQNTLSGTVTSPCGTYIPNATVTLTTRASAEINTTQTDSTGHYAFANVSPNYYDINATKRSYWSNTNNVTVTAEAPETADIVLCQKGDFNTNSEPADAGDLAMMADATAAGTSDVTYDLDGDGNPADEADLTLLKEVSVGVAVLE